MNVKSEVLGKRFRVYFRYLPAMLTDDGIKEALPEVPFDVADSRATKCDIKDMETNEVIATGIAYCDTRDQFEKSKGRRLAFQHALRRFKSYAPAGSPMLMMEADADRKLRSIRREFWKAYFSEMDKKLVCDAK